MLELEIHSISHGNIFHIVCELKESENKPSTSFKKLGGGGGGGPLDYNVSSAPFQSRKRLKMYKCPL